MLGAWIDRYWIWVLLAGATGAFASIPGPTPAVEVAATLAPRPRAPWVILPGEPVSSESLNNALDCSLIVSRSGTPISWHHGIIPYAHRCCDPRSSFVTEVELPRTSLNHFDLLDRTEIAGGSTMVAVNQAAWNDLSLETN